ncbi:retrovirus-related pol polyprotein from transposon TNT 1-94 [Tanacetum coccineum]
MDQEKTTFTCPFGTYAYRRIPFGLFNAPTTFQRCMLAIYHDMVEESVEVFMDDFFIFGNSFDHFLNNLDKMIQRCKDANLVLNWEKCHFMVKKGIVLGHKVSGAGLEVDKAKIDVISKLPPPTNVKGIRSFLGHVGFNRRPFSKSYKFEYILVVVDYVSKWAKAQALPTNNAKFVISFLKELLCRFGMPKALISDRGLLIFYKKYGMETCDPVDTPMVEKSKLDEDPQEKAVDPTCYHGIIDILMYLTSSRPDLVFVVCMYVRYQAKPTEKHLHAVKRIFRYLRGTINMDMWYSKGSCIALTAFADADHAGYQDTKKSTSGSTQLLGDRLEQVENGVVELYFVRTEYQLADIFTKPSARERLDFLINKLGMRSMSPETLQKLADKQEEIKNPQEIQQVTAHDEKWVPSTKRVKISSTNVRLETTMQQKEETFQVVIDIIMNSTCFKAFTISADVPEIFMQQFWYTINNVKESESYEFLLANKKCIIDAEVFRKILDICPRVEGEDYQEYGLAIPDVMLNNVIKQSESYQMFIKYSTGEIPPKKRRGKGSQGKKTVDVSQETVDVSEESEPKPAKKRTTSRRVVKKKVDMNGYLTKRRKTNQKATK